MPNTREKIKWCTRQNQKESTENREGLHAVDNFDWDRHVDVCCYDIRKFELLSRLCCISVITKDGVRV